MTGLMSGEGGIYGRCQSGPSGAGYLSHTARQCQAGWTLDVARGICVKGECCEKPLCGSGERYTRSETYGGRTYGDCQSGPGFGGVLSHTNRECEAGWDLDVGSGLCKKRGCGIAISPAGPPVAPRPPEVVRKPDLTIKDWWVRPDARPGAASNEVKLHQKYQVCFIVANIGSAPSGPFNVQGGGLGIPTNPMQRHAGLAQGGTPEGCLDYPTTPPPGTYHLVVTADVPNAVAESSEANNGRSEAITVLP